MRIRTSTGLSVSPSSAVSKTRSNESVEVEPWYVVFCRPASLLESTVLAIWYLSVAGLIWTSIFAGSAGAGLAVGFDDTSCR